MSNNRLFPIDLPSSQWHEFEAAGFNRPVSGAIFRDDDPPCCGAPIGGLSTGSIDLDVRGVFGWSMLFNPGSDNTARSGRTPRTPPRPEPILGLAVCGETWVLTPPTFIEGGRIPWCTEPLNPRARDVEKPQDFVTCAPIEDVRNADRIHYLGHYPVVDVEYETSAPVSLGMRAWAPFIQGALGPEHARRGLRGASPE